MPDNINPKTEKRDPIPVKLEDGTYYYDPETDQEIPELFEPDDFGNDEVAEDYDENSEDEEDDGETEDKSESDDDDGEEGAPEDLDDDVPSSEEQTTGGTPTEVTDEAAKTAELAKEAEEVAEAAELLEAEALTAAATEGTAAATSELWVPALGVLLVVVIIVVIAIGFLGAGTEEASGLTPTSTGTLVGDYYMPVDVGVGFGIISEYGMRVHPRTGKLKMHYGVDININGRGDAGKAVYTIQDGKIIEATRRSSGCGTILGVDHGSGNVTRYVHLTNKDGIGLKIGDTVVGGQQIGTIANIGGESGNNCSSGPHLHFETRIGGTKVNPRDVIDFSKL